ncbi:MAG: MFS transporter [Candidatus Curtissbacteria bacterium]|nr:MFS transporter [Candidatus Curtissbacteria bacterium]
MKLIPKAYLQILGKRDFLVLSLVNFLFQATTSFILLALVVTVFSKTGSNFGVSGVIVSFSLSGLFLMAFAGVLADLVDRKKIIVLANFVEFFIILAILLAIEKVFASIVFSFFYFAVNALYLPAASASVAQVVKRNKLQPANSIFVFTMAGGQMAGFFAASVVQFFFGHIWALVICEILTLFALYLSTFLPSLVPKGRERSPLEVTKQLFNAFIYVFGKSGVWFFFTIFAFMQGLIAVGVTLGPGFFNEILGVGVKKSPLIIFPAISLGVILGTIYMHFPRVHESRFVALGLGVIGVASFLVASFIKYDLLASKVLLLPVSIFITLLGFGVMVIMISSRTVLQQTIPHYSQGTLFGAAIILSSFFAGFMSPFSAALEALFGYVNFLLFGGIIFMLSSLVLVKVGERWKF